MEVQLRQSQSLQLQQIQIMYKYQQPVPHKQPHPQTHQQSQVPNSQVQQQLLLVPSRRLNRARNQHSSLNRSLNPIIKATVMDTEVVIGEEDPGSEAGVEIVVDTIPGHPWDKITTDKTVMDKEIIDKGHQWEIPHPIEAVVVIIRIWVVHSTIPGSRLIQLL